MKRLALSVLGTALVVGSFGTVFAQSNSTTITSGPGGVAGGTTITDSRGQPCGVVQRNDGGSGNTGTLSSTVTAGPNGVHSSSTGGPSVTVRSGDGRSTSTATSSSSSGSTVVTGSGSGDCDVTVDHGRGAAKHK